MKRGQSVEVGVYMCVFVCVHTCVSWGQGKAFIGDTDSRAPK